MQSFRLDLRYALRALRRTPYVTVAACLSIGLGVGAAAAVFSWMDATIIHPFRGVADQGRLIGIEVGEPNGGMGAWSYRTYKELRDATQSFTGMAAWRILRVAAREPTETGSSPVLATMVSGNYFDVLGARPTLGRFLTDGDIDAITPVAVLGAQYWIDRYHGDPAVIGRTLLLNGQSVTIVGVAPSGFAGVYTGVVPQLYVPLTMQPVLSGVSTLEDRKNRSWLVFARLAPGATLETARRDADAAAKRITASYGDRPAPGALLMDLRVEFLGATLAPLLTAMLAVAGVLLLLASANVATLLLVRGDARAAEIALRRVLGASRWRIVRVTLVESALLAAGGGLVGVAIAYVARGTLYSLIPHGAFTISLPIGISWRLLVAALAAALMVTVLCGLGPALAALGVDTNDKRRTRQTARTVSVGRSLVRSSIVGGQLAFSMAALVVATMFIRGLQKAAAVDVGFSDAEHVLLVDTDFSAARLTGTRGVAALEELLQKLRALPGITSATVASMVPLGFGGRRIVEMNVEGYAAAPNENMSAERAHVGSAYAATMHIHVVRGRDITSDDHSGTLPVALVNEAFVKRFFLGGDAVGRRVDAGNGWATIVGVLHDGKYDRLDEPLHPVVYVPTTQWFLPAMTIHVRAARDPHALAEPVRRALLSINVDLPAVQARTLAEHISASTFVPRTGALVVGGFAILALLLSMVGLYGALSYSVSLERREIALKLALGAASREIMWGVGRYALTLAAVGLVAGGALTIVASSLLRARVPVVGAIDLPIAIALVLVLLVVTTIAAWIPSRNAMRVDPAVALRGD